MNFYPVIEIKLGVGTLMECFAVARHSFGGNHISLSVEDARVISGWRNSKTDVTDVHCCFG